uniref:Uncharacterized protein n=1 Tax=Arundo donax TaxID=35708 RepID=A0A0A9C6Z8_ARUDO
MYKLNNFIDVALYRWQLSNHCICLTLLYSLRPVFQGAFCFGTLANEQIKLTSVTSFK